MIIIYRNGHRSEYDFDTDLHTVIETGRVVGPGDSLDCPKCEIACFLDQPDPCIGLVEGAKFACCGHGVDDNMCRPYVMWRHDTSAETRLAMIKKYDMGTWKQSVELLEPNERGAFYEIIS